MTLTSIVIGAAVLAAVLALQSAGRSPSARRQNLVLFLAGTAVYGILDLRALPVLLGSALADYFLAQRTEAATADARRKVWTGLSITLNLGLLVFFKYVGFMQNALARFASWTGSGWSPGTWSLWIPLGISFYVLQRLSYTLDVHRGQMKASRDILAFLAWASFFPLIPSGPIERARRLLPQFSRPRVYDAEQATDGLRRLLGGLFKKVVVADTLAPFVDSVFRGASHLPASELGMGVLLFSVQIYCDFAGYSDLAIGLARLLGFRVMDNFSTPYFARNIAEFWHRWHISLSSWFRDYLFTPLTWRVPLAAKARRLAAIVLTFAASGLWHGAAARFIVWGTLHGLYFAPVLFGWVPPHSSNGFGREGRRRALRDLPLVLATSLGVSLAWIPFRAASLGRAWEYARGLLSSSWLQLPRGKWLFVFAMAFLAAEWFQSDRRHVMDLRRLPAGARWAVYLGVSVGLLLFGRWSNTHFIYMQF